VLAQSRVLQNNTVPLITGKAHSLKNFKSNHYKDQSLDYHLLLEEMLGNPTLNSSFQYTFNFSFGNI
jgi:hypothetical protein